jgi:hypothetical protein
MSGGYFDLQDKLVKEKHFVRNLPPNESNEAQQRAVQQLAATQRVYDNVVNTLVESEIPLANLYRAELVKRLGSEIPMGPWPPDSKSINRFLSDMENFDAPAKKL